jgi:hypothetical protein
MAQGLVCGVVAYGGVRGAKDMLMSNANEHPLVKVASIGAGFFAGGLISPVYVKMKLDDWLEYRRKNFLK